MTESRVLAVVQGKEITEEIVLKFLNDLGPQMAMQFQSPEGMKRVVDELVNQEIIYLDAKEKEMDKEEEYLKELDRLQEGLMKQYAVNKLLKDIVVSEEDVEKYYNDNKDRFMKPESLVASHILVEDEEKANEIVKEINEGLSFEEPVKTNFGYHIIKVSAKNEGSVSSFDEVKDQLTQQLLGIKQQEFYLVKTDELKQKYEVVVNM